MKGEYLAAGIRVTLLVLISQLLMRQVNRQLILKH